MRSFLALDLPEAARGDLVRLQRHLRSGRRVAPDNLHLTLVFLGDVAEDTLAVLHGDLETLVAKAVTLQFDGLVAIGEAVAPRVVAVSVTASDALAGLQARVTRLARAAGIDVPRTRFRPHVTLARFGRSAPADRMMLDRFLGDNAGFTAGPAVARSMTLYASTLRPGGAEYDPLASYPLG